eukprot:UN22673
MHWGLCKGYWMRMMILLFFRVIFPISRSTCYLMIGSLRMPSLARVTVWYLNIIFDLIF